jgi:KDO2-lipid IV(A) lauroyltransferase
LARFASRVSEVVMVRVTRAFFALLRALGPYRASDWGGALARTFGPLLPAHRTALKNLRAAFPEKPKEEIRAIAKGAWENLGRVGAEYAHLGWLFDPDYHNPQPGTRVEIKGFEYFEALKHDGKPALIFSAHLANWELGAICAARGGLDMTAVFRAPNDPAVASVVHEIRSDSMGALAAARDGAAFVMQGVLERGGHLAMLVDQHFTRGVVTEFFGRPALTNALLGKFARHYECPVHGARVVRKPGLRFTIELTPPLDLPRDPDGAVDVAGTMAAITRQVEVWVREHPEQWLWMHRRWRPEHIRVSA